MLLFTPCRASAQPSAARRRLLLALPIAALGVALGGCTTAPRRTVPVKLNLKINAAPDINPDLNARPSPVLLSLYKLRKFETFRTLDYFALTAAESHAEFRLEEAFSVHPSSQLIRSYTLEPDEIGFGLVVAYRDIANSQWRVSTELPALKVSRIKLPEVLTRSDPEMAYRIDIARNTVSVTREERS
jgi:type VI secretion system protein VasD